MTSMPENYEEFLEWSNSGGFESNLKELYSTVKNVEIGKKKEGIMLDSLIIENMHVEQIWQQIELINNNKISAVRKTCKQEIQVELKEQLQKLVKLLKKKVKNDEIEVGNESLEDEEISGSESINPDEIDGDIDADMKSEDGSQEIEKEIEDSGENEKLEDGFLSLEAMHKFMDDQDSKFEKGEEESMDFEKEGIDLFQQHESVDSLRYKDFFDPPEISGLANKPRTTFQNTQEKLREKISEFETENVSEKPWLMKGEASAEMRPENSALEEFLDFDQMTRLPPVITEDFTVKLEDMLKQRIKDKAFDDVERKKKPVRDAQKYRNELVLEQEKSKASLSQIYEQEFLKQKEKNAEEKSNPGHLEIRTAMVTLFRKLDALSNYHYTPPLPVSEVRVVENVVSLNVEEVGPEVNSHEQMLAPEEIKSGLSSEFKAKSERSSTDKKRALRKKKIKQSRKAEIMEEREKGGAAGEKEMNKLRKVGRVKKAKLDPKAGKSVGVSSATFFSRLQSEAKNDVNNKKDRKSTESNKKGDKTSAQYKL